MNLAIIVKNEYEYKIKITMFYTEQSIIYRATVVNPPQSFWDNHKILEGKTIEEAMKKAAQALDYSIEQQWMN